VRVSLSTLTLTKYCKKNVPKQIRQHQRLRQQQHLRLVVNRAVVMDVVVLVQGLNLFVVRVEEEAEAQSGVLPMIQRWIVI